MTGIPLRIARGFGYLTLDPSPRLRRLREEAEGGRRHAPFGVLLPLPDSAYPPGAVPLDCSGVPRCTCPPCWGGLCPPPACPLHGQTEMVQVRC